MCYLKVCFSFVFGAILFLPSAHAEHFASVEASAFEVESGHGNYDSQLGATTASASYSNPEGGSASSFATFGATSKGGLSMKVFATATAGALVSNGAGASLSWQDALHTSGTLLDLLIDLRFEFTGSKSGDASISAGMGYCVGDYCPVPLSFDGPATIHLTADELIPPTTPVSISIGMSAFAGGIALTGPSTSTADFSHSLDLVSITLRDANGNFVPGVTITSDSGFDYNPLIVPEPTSCLLLAIGCAAITCRRRRCTYS